MEFDVNLESLEESNMFLRALWAEFRKKYGKCAWSFQPYKRGKDKYIYFGQMDIGIEDSISVGINYSRKGCISKIHFEGPHIDNLKNDFKVIIETARQNLKKGKRFTLSTTFTSLHGIVANYKGKNFKIYHDLHKKINILEISMVGYDRVDAQTKSQEIIRNILDVLSAGTNSMFIYSKRNDIKKPQKIKWNSPFQNDKEWLEGIPMKNGMILLQIEILDFIDEIVSGNNKQNDIYILNSCALFHSGRKIDAQVNDLLEITDEKINNTEHMILLRKRDFWDKSNELNILNSEIANILYISSIEALVNYFPYKINKCSECGQPIYSITKRVTEFVERNLGSLIAKLIKEEYVKRSKFLHTGRLFAKRNYIGVSIPQLDPESISGCEIQTTIPSQNLREYVSFLIRKTIINRIKQIS